MMKLVFSNKAEKDLEDILDYIRERSPKAAEKILDKLEHAFFLLKEAPQMGHLRSDLTKHKLRFWLVESYLVIYKVSFRLEIVRILSGYRDISKILS